MSRTTHPHHAIRPPPLYPPRSGDLALGADRDLRNVVTRLLLCVAAVLLLSAPSSWLLGEDATDGPACCNALADCGRVPTADIIVLRPYLLADAISKWASPPVHHHRPGNFSLDLRYLSSCARRTGTLIMPSYKGRNSGQIVAVPKNQKTLRVCVPTRHT